MKAFISYSHKDAAMLERLHVHLTQLKRDGLINSWTDEQIPAGGNLGAHISTNLDNAQLFIALLSPDYIASNYCYEKEFKKAQEMEKSSKLLIVPIILEPCEWLSTPFSDFKALPKDGKPISEWSNANTAFLDIVQGLRALVKKEPTTDDFVNSANTTGIGTPSRNYRVKRDFDSIEKIEFAEDTFNDIKEKLTAYLNEIIQVDPNIKYRIVNNDSKLFEALLVNRNKANAECTLKINNDSELHVRSQLSHYNMALGKYDLAYTLGSERNNQAKGFEMKFDEFHLFWEQSNTFHSSQEQKEFTSKDIADGIWNEWLDNVGIM